MTTAERDQRIVLIVAIAATTAVLTILQENARTWASDFNQSMIGFRLLVHGLNPWEAARITYEGRVFPLLYPLPALLVAAPVAWLPSIWADAIFMGVSAALLTWGLTRQTVRNPQLLVFASFAFFFAIDTVQWSPLLVSSVLIPWLGFLLTCKPSIGLALLVGYPSRAAIIGCAIAGLVTLAIAPHWIQSWLAVLPRADHVVAPVRLPFGAIMLLALAKWRRPEARLLAALACIPHSLGLNEAVLLFLVVRRWWEGGLLVALTVAVWLVRLHDHTVYSTLSAYAAALGVWQVWLLYLPCVAMVLRRRNVWADQPETTLRRTATPARVTDGAPG